MDFALTPEQQAFVNEFRDYLSKHLTPEVRAECHRFMNMSKRTDPGVFGKGEYGGPKSKAFVRRLGADGWLGVGWPREYGGQGRTPMEQHLFFETIYAEQAPFPVLTLNAMGPAIMEYGTDEQKKDFLPRILKGDLEIAIGYTEPEAGTDLFSLRTSAVKDGGYYIINGQKVFTSLAHIADYIWLAARTDPDVSKKHRGVSIFLIPVDAPGITIAPIYTLGGHRTNSVFFEDVRVPKSCLIGQENRGVEVITYQLDRERIALVPSLPLIRRIEKMITWAKKTKINGTTVLEQAGVRTRFAEMIAEVEVLKLLNYDVVQKMTKGLPVWAEASTVKVYGSELNMRISNNLLEIMGPYGQVQRSDRWAPADGVVEEHFRDDLIFIFGGGANEVQRDIIAMVGLGMPRSR
jgi:hypothetical protein